VYAGDAAASRAKPAEETWFVTWFWELLPWRPTDGTVSPGHDGSQGEAEGPPDDSAAGSATGAD
jgi:hypothetical protein